MGALLLPAVVGVFVALVCVFFPPLVPQSAGAARQLLVINVPLTLVCLYLVWLMAYLSQVHLFQLPELAAAHH